MAQNTHMTKLNSPQTKLLLQNNYRAKGLTPANNYFASIKIAHWSGQSSLTCSIF